MGNMLGNSGKVLKTARLFARVGLKGMTPLKGYRLLRYWVLDNVFKMQIPWLIELSVTYRCQCGCAHCSVSNYFDEANKRKKEELTKDEINSVLDQAVKMGIPKVDYFGGEPLLRKDIVELVSLGASKGLYMSLTTNGWLLTREMVKALKQSGISCINISLDSVSEEEHDRLRTLPGLFKKATDGVRYCYEEGIPCITSTYVTRERMRNFGPGENDDSDLTKVILLSRQLKASGIRILFPIISGEWVNDAGKGFSQEDARKVIDNIDPSFAFIEGAFSVKSKSKVCQSLSGKMFNISPYGEVQLCVAFTNVFGNVKDAPLKEVLKSMYSHPTFIKNKNSSCCSTNELKKC